MPAISKRTLKELRWTRDWLREGNGGPTETWNRAIASLDVVLDACARPRSVKFARKRRTVKRLSKKEETGDIRYRVFHRARGTCELLGADGKRCTLVASDCAHLFGRGKGRLPQSERTCIAACWQCHRVTLTLNQEGGEECWRRVAMTLQSLGYTFEAHRALNRENWCRVRNALPAAPRTGR